MVYPAKMVPVMVAVLLAAPMSASAHDPVPGPAPTAARLDPAAAEAANVVDAFHAALKAGDTSKAESLLADAVLIFEAGGAERSRSDYAAHHLPADAAFAKLATETLNRRSGGGGGNFAWIASEGAVRPQAEGKAQQRITTETMILEKTAGIWRIVHAHWSSRALPTTAR